jgi:DUF4097 and DUF4098 domain-containing protein YvlB
MDKKLKTQWLAGLAAAVVMIALVAAPALAEQKFEEKFEKTVPLSKTGLFSLSNISGNTQVMTWKEAQVKIEALKVSKADTQDKAKENAAKVTIDVTAEADAVRVETNYPKHNGGFWGGDSIKVSVDYKVWIPEQAGVELKSISGDVEVAAIGGKAKIECVSGDVGLQGAAGADIKLTSGDLKMQNISGDAYIKAVSGDLDVTKVKGSIKAEAVSGDIKLLEVSDASTIDVKTVSGNVTYQGAIAAGAHYEFKTMSGDVKVTLPADSSFDLEASTFNGDIDNEFQITTSGKISPREIRGTVGRGGATLNLKTFSGNVDIKKK